MLLTSVHRSSLALCFSSVSPGLSFVSAVYLLLVCVHVPLGACCHRVCLALPWAVTVGTLPAGLMLCCQPQQAVGMQGLSSSDGNTRQASRVWGSKPEDGITQDFWVDQSTQGDACCTTCIKWWQQQAWWIGGGACMCSQHRQ